jgi:hypothetical protein
MLVLLSRGFWGLDLVQCLVCSLLEFGIATGFDFASSEPPVRNPRDCGEDRDGNLGFMMSATQQQARWCLGNRGGERTEDLICDVSFQASDYVPVGSTLGTTASEVAAVRGS